MVFLHHLIMLSIVVLLCLIVVPASCLWLLEQLSRLLIAPLLVHDYLRSLWIYRRFRRGRESLKPDLFFNQVSDLLWEELQTFPYKFSGCAELLPVIHNLNPEFIQWLIQTHEFAQVFPEGVFAEAQEFMALSHLGYRQTVNLNQPQTFNMYLRESWRYHVLRTRWQKYLQSLKFRKDLENYQFHKWVRTRQLPK